MLLVRLVGSLGVTDLSLEVVLLVLDEVSDTGEVSPLGVGVNVHLDDTVDNGLSDLVLGRTGSTVEDKVADASAKVRKGNPNRKSKKQNLRIVAPLRHLLLHEISETTLLMTRGEKGIEKAGSNVLNLDVR